MSDEKKSRSKRAVKRAALLTGLILVIGVSAFAGWLAMRSPFLGGAMVGLCLAFPVGALTGVVVLAAMIADEPERWIETFKKP